MITSTLGSNMLNVWSTAIYFNKKYTKKSCWYIDLKLLLADIDLYQYLCICVYDSEWSTILMNEWNTVKYHSSLSSYEEALHKMYLLYSLYIS